MMSILFIVCYAWILWFLNQTNVVSEQQAKQSVTYEKLEPIPDQTRGAFEQLKPAFKGFWDKSTEAIKESKEEERDHEIIQK